MDSKEELSTEEVCFEKLGEVSAKVQVITNEASLLAEKANVFAESTQNDANSLNIKIQNVSKLYKDSHEASISFDKDEQSTEFTREISETSEDTNKDGIPCSRDSNNMDDVSSRETTPPQPMESEKYEIVSTDEDAEKKLSIVESAKKFGSLFTMFNGVKNKSTNNESIGFSSSDILEEIESSPSQLNMTGNINITAAIGETKQLNENLNESEGLAIRTKSLIEEALAMQAPLTDEGIKHQNSLIENLKSSEKTVISTIEYIRSSKDSVDTVLEPHSSHTDNGKRVLRKVSSKDINRFCIGLGCGIGCGYILAMVFKKKENN